MCRLNPRTRSTLHPVRRTYNPDSEPNFEAMRLLPIRGIRPMHTTPPVGTTVALPVNDENLSSDSKELLQSPRPLEIDRARISGVGTMLSPPQALPSQVPESRSELSSPLNVAETLVRPAASSPLAAGGAFCKSINTTSLPPTYPNDIHALRVALTDYIIQELAAATLSALPHNRIHPQSPSISLATNPLNLSFPSSFNGSGFASASSDAQISPNAMLIDNSNCRSDALPALARGFNISTLAPTNIYLPGFGISAALPTTPTAPPPLCPSSPLLFRYRLNSYYWNNC